MAGACAAHGSNKAMTCLRPSKPCELLHFTRPRVKGHWYLDEKCGAFICVAAQGIETYLARFLSALSVDRRLTTGRVFVNLTVRYKNSEENFIRGP